MIDWIEVYAEVRVALGALPAGAPEVRVRSEWKRAAIGAEDRRGKLIVTCWWSVARGIQLGAYRYAIADVDPDSDRAVVRDQAHEMVRYIADDMAGPQRRREELLRLRREFGSSLVSPHSCLPGGWCS